MAVRTKFKRREIKVQNVAEREVMRFADNQYLWSRHVCGVELNPHQLVYCEELDAHASNLLIGSRRVQKSFSVAQWMLREAATKRLAEINIHSPTLEQSKRNLKTMTDSILQSPILEAYIENRLGAGIGKEYIEFVNRSVCQAKGQASSTDGLGATHQWLEEFDDMDWDTFQTRIYPTGSQIKPGFDYGKMRVCRRVVTGTIKGKGNIYRLEHPDEGTSLRFHVLPKLNCYFGIAAGIIPEEDIIMARETLMTPAQFARTYLCLYTESLGYITTQMIHQCQNPFLLPEVPLPDSTFHARGPVTFGMDFEGQGESEEASHTTISFVEQLKDGTVNWLYGKRWNVGTAPSQVREEVVEMIRYFRPVGGVGDAYGASEIFEINVSLYNARLTRKNAAGYMNKDGKGGWDEWFFKPIRYHGPQKHLMFKKLQSKMLGGIFRFPVPIEDYPRDGYQALSLLLNQFENVKAIKTKMGYDSFKMIRKAMGDDMVDATVGAVWSLPNKKGGGKAFGGGTKSKGFKEDRRFAKRDNFKRIAG